MFDPLDFLRVAEELSLATQDEAKIRTSIGRSYFSAFLFAREWLYTKSWPLTNSGADHRLCYKGLRKHVNRTTGDMLGSLYRDNRGDADYDLIKTLQQNDAINAITLSKTIISNIRTVSTPPAPAIPATSSPNSSANPT